MNDNTGTVTAPSFETVRPRETSQRGDRHSKRGKTIKIGGPIKYDYDTKQVMAGSRGDETQEGHRYGQGKDFKNMSETPKKGKFGD